MKPLIKTINLSYPAVKKVYELYVKAEKSGKSALKKSLKKSVYDMQEISRIGGMSAFPVAMKPEFDKNCKPFDPDCYLVDNNKLAKLFDDFAKRCQASQAGVSK